MPRRNHVQYAQLPVFRYQTFEREDLVFSSIPLDLPPPTHINYFGEDFADDAWKPEQVLVGQLDVVDIDLRASEFAETLDPPFEEPPIGKPTQPATDELLPVLLLESAAEDMTSDISPDAAAPDGPAVDQEDAASVQNCAEAAPDDLLAGLVLDGPIEALDLLDGDYEEGEDYLGTEPEPEAQQDPCAFTEEQAPRDVIDALSDAGSRAVEVTSVAGVVEKHQEANIPPEQISQVLDKAFPEADPVESVAEAEAAADHPNPDTTAENLTAETLLTDDEKAAEPEPPTEEAPVSATGVEATSEDVTPPGEGDAAPGADPTPDEGAPEAPTDTMAGDSPAKGTTGNTVDPSGEDSPMGQPLMVEEPPAAEEPPPEEPPVGDSPADDPVAAVDSEEAAAAVTEGAPTAAAPSQLPAESGVEETAVESAAAEEAIPEIPFREPTIEGPPIEVAAVANESKLGTAPTPIRPEKLEKERRRRKQRDIYGERDRQASSMNGHKTRLERNKNDKGPLVNTIAAAVEKARKENNDRRSTPAYKEKLERRKQKEKTNGEIEKAKKKASREQETMREEEAKAERRAIKALEKEKERSAKEVAKQKEQERVEKQKGKTKQTEAPPSPRLGKRKIRRPSIPESSGGDSASANPRPAVFKKIAMGESDCGGPLLKINFSKTEEYNPRSPPTPESRLSHREKASGENGHRSPYSRQRADDSIGKEKNIRGDDAGEKDKERNKKAYDDQPLSRRHGNSKSESSVDEQLPGMKLKNALVHSFRKALLAH